VRVEFGADRFAVRDLSLSLVEGRAFLFTEQRIPRGTTGTLVFRVTPWDPPFRVRGEVVRVGPAGGAGDEGPPGIGIRLLDLSDENRRRLQRLVDDVRDGSVVESIRRSLRESPRGLDQELRLRTPDQKMLLAICAQGEEIDALLRDGHPSVLQRLLENPRLQIQHVRALARDPRMPTRLLLDIRRKAQWFRDDEVRWSFCRHPKAPFHDVQHVLTTLAVPRLQQIVADSHVRPNVRNKAKDVLKRKRSGG
jgi:hypothetical protein